MSQCVVDLVVRSQVASPHALHADVANTLCVFPRDLRSQQSGSRGANWRLEIRQCTLRSIKVICTHNIERSLVFINPAARIGPENQIKKIVPVLSPTAAFRSCRLVRSDFPDLTALCPGVKKVPKNSFSFSVSARVPLRLLRYRSNANSVSLRNR